MFRSVILGALLLTGCVSTSRYEEDTAALSAKVTKLQKTSAAQTQLVCGLVAENCLVETILQAAITQEEFNPEEVQAACAAKGLACIQQAK